MKASLVTITEKDELWVALDELNGQGHTPAIPGVDSEGRSFLAYLTEEGGDCTAPGLLFDEPHEPSYGMDRDRTCAECGCPHRRWGLAEAVYPVWVLRLSFGGDS